VGGKRLDLRAGPPNLAGLNLDEYGLGVRNPLCTDAIPWRELGSNPDARGRARVLSG
jgi:hypothetical protein